MTSTVDSKSGKHWFTRSIFWGLFLSVWVTGWFMLYQWVAKSGWPLQTINTGTFRQTYFHWKWHEIEYLPLYVFVLPLSLVVIWSIVEYFTAMDRERLSTASVKWGLHLFTSWKWCIVLLLFLVTFFLRIAWQGSSSIYELVEYVILLLIPFTVFQKRVVRNDAGPGLHPPSFPGLQTLVAFVVLTIVLFFVMVTMGLQMDIANAPYLALLILLVVSLVWIRFMLYPAEILVFRARIRRLPGMIKALFKWDRLGPALAVFSRFLYILMVVATPLIIFIYFVGFNVNGMSAWHIQNSLETPDVVTSLIRARFQLEFSGQGIARIMVILFESLLFGRLVWLMHERDEALISDEVKE